MKKPYQPRPAGRHIVDPKTGKLTRSGDYTLPAGSPAAGPVAADQSAAANARPTQPAPEKPAPADKKGD
ncbi:MAG: hypothetical protein J0H60_22860 [Rhizobiales bacterium]|nr:hypothetical protein [Hyphomicrobiales bacterium]